MKKVCAVLFVLLLAVASFAQVHDANVVRWKTIVGNITVSNNDAVAGINPGTTPWSTTGGRASVNLVTGNVSFDVEGLVLNGGNATGTPDGIDQVEGSLICDAGAQDQTIFTTTPVQLNAQGNADFSGTFNTIPGTCKPCAPLAAKPNAVAGEVKWPRHFSLGRRPSLRTYQMRDLMRSAGRLNSKRQFTLPTSAGSNPLRWDAEDLRVRWIVKVSSFDL
jgi:hypothetical protein